MACFSQVSPSIKRDYDLDFSNCQTLEVTEEKLRRASRILAGTQSTLSSVKQHSKTLKGLDKARRGPKVFAHCRIEKDLQECLDNVVVYERELRSLFQRAKNTKYLVGASNGTL